MERVRAMVALMLACHAAAAAAAAPAALRPAAILRSRFNTSCILIFGDSTVDSGNNNRLRTTAKADFPPYGKDFFSGKATGRFCNGRLATDILAERMGVLKYIPAFLDPDLKPEQLRHGVSFASGSSGYDEATAKTANVLSIPKQLEYLQHYKMQIQKQLGWVEAANIIETAFFVTSAGTNDLFNNYILSKQSTTAFNMPQYEDYLVNRLDNYTKEMHKTGGRRFVVVGVPPMGCLPIAKALLGADKCNDELNDIANSFNLKVQRQLSTLEKELSVKTLYIDIYHIMLEALADPNKFGLSVTSKGCCGSGMIEIGETCEGLETCKDPSKYMFWDAVHPTERMYEIITNRVIMGAVIKTFV